MGSYVDESLVPGEAVSYKANLSTWSLLPQYAVAAVFLALSVGVLLIPSRFLETMPATVACTAFAVVGLGGLVATLVKFYTTELAITDRRVIAKFGFVERRAIDLRIEKVESVQVIQGMLARLLRYGTLVISAAGTENAVIPGISHPIRFRDHYHRTELGLGTRASESGTV